MGIYLVSGSINQVIPVLLLPIFTVYLIPADYGYINNFSAILLIASAFIGGGLSANIFKNYYTKDENYTKTLMGNLYFILLCLTGLFFTVAVFASSILEIGLIPKKIFILIPGISFFIISYDFLKTILRVKKKVLSFALVTLSEAVFNITLSLVLVIGFYLQWKGRIYGVAISFVAFGLISLGYFIKHNLIKFTLDKTIMADILKLSIPLIPSVVGIIIMRRNGIFFVDAFFGKSEAGIYGIGLNISMVILLVSVACLNAWIPYVYEKLAEKTEKERTLLRNGIFIFSIAIFGLGVLISLFSGLILQILTTEAYYGAGIYIPWLVFGFAFWAIQSMHVPFFVHHGKQKYIAFIALFGVGLNITLNYFLIKTLGAIGVAVSFLISNFITYLLVFFSVRTFNKLPVLPDLRKIGAMIQGLIK